MSDKDKRYTSQTDFGKYERKSAFDLKRLPKEVREYIKDKAVRWSSPGRVEEHKDVDGYHVVTGGRSADGTNQAKRMVLMARSKEQENESMKSKRYRAMKQQGKSKEKIGEELERLSSKHGINLHKHVTQNEEDQ